MGGTSYCFSCTTYTHAKEDEEPERITKDIKTEFLKGTFAPISSRGLTKQTCSKFGYTVGTDEVGEAVQVAPFYDANGNLVAQSVRKKDKKFKWRGNYKKALPLFGQHLWKPGGKRLIITEGVIDCLSISQIQDNKWPIVSLAGGAGSCKKEFEAALEFLESFETVVLCFDMDEPGRSATDVGAKILSPGKAHVVTLPLKDANEMLVNGKGSDLTTCLWNANQYRPDSIVQLVDIVDKVLEPVKFGLSWWDDRLTALTYGRRTGELYCLGAGTGIGKTDWLIQQIAFDLKELDEKVGVFFFEQQPQETVKRLCSKVDGKGYYLPESVGGWTEGDLKKCLEVLDTKGNLFLYDHFGCTDWKVIASHIKYLAKAEGVKLFYIDHLTALAAGSDLNEKDALEQIMSALGGMVKELDITVHLVSHLSTPDGASHEEGGRVMIRQFKGSRTIGYWCHFMFGIERNPQDDDPVQRTISTFRILKDRVSGKSTGKTLQFTMDPESYSLIQVEDETDCGHLFKDETNDDEDDQTAF